MSLQGEPALLEGVLLGEPVSCCPQFLPCAPPFGVLQPPRCCCPIPNAFFPPSPGIQGCPGLAWPQGREGEELPWVRRGSWGSHRLCPPPHPKVTSPRCLLVSPYQGEPGGAGEPGDPGEDVSRGHRGGVKVKAAPSPPQGELPLLPRAPATPQNPPDGSVSLQGAKGASGAKGEKVSVPSTGTRCPATPCPPGGDPVPVLSAPPRRALRVSVCGDHQDRTGLRA